MTTGYVVIEVGDTVSGTYFGTPYVGIVTARRWHSYRHDARELSIAVPEGWNHKGRPERGIIVYVGPDGGPCPGFSREGVTVIERAA